MNLWFCKNLSLLSCRISPEELFFDYFSFNHLAWARKVFLKGVDILPELRRTLEHTPQLRISNLSSVRKP